MRIPESLFVIVNVIVRTLLKSPLHFFMSKSVMLIGHKGRKSGTLYSTPVRYVRVGEVIRCFTSHEVQWWRNVAANPDITLLVAGSQSAYTANVLPRDPVHTQALLEAFLAVYPQDCVYHDIDSVSDGNFDSRQLETAANKAVVVEFTAGEPVVA